MLHKMLEEISEETVNLANNTLASEPNELFPEESEGS